MISASNAPLACAAMARGDSSGRTAPSRRERFPTCRRSTPRPENCETSWLSVVRAPAVSRIGVTQAGLFSGRSPARRSAPDSLPRRPRRLPGRRRRTLPPAQQNAPPAGTSRIGGRWWCPGRADQGGDGDPHRPFLPRLRPGNGRPTSPPCAGETMNIFAASPRVRPSSTTSRASRSRARGVRAAFAWDTRTSGGVKRFLDSSTSQLEVLAYLNDRPTSTQPATTSLGNTASVALGMLSYF